MILEKGGPAFRATLETMAETTAGVILFHCTAGRRSGARPRSTAWRAAATHGVEGGAARSRAVSRCATLGKDRTGVLAALILLILGVDDELICWDYEQSELAIARTRPQQR